MIKGIIMDWTNQALSKLAMQEYKEETIKMAKIMISDGLTFQEAMLLIKGTLEENNLGRIYYLTEYWVKGVYDGKTG